MPVATIVGMVADGMTIAKILKEHPTLEAEDIGSLDRGQAGLVAGAPHPWLLLVGAVRGRDLRKE
jgi:hypothetical protein